MCVSNSLQVENQYSVTEDQQTRITLVCQYLATKDQQTRITLVCQYPATKDLQTRITLVCQYLATKDLVDSSWFLERTLINHFLSHFLHKQHEGIQRLLNDRPPWCPLWRHGWLGRWRQTGTSIVCWLVMSHH